MKQALQEKEGIQVEQIRYIGSVYMWGVAACVLFSVADLALLAGPSIHLPSLSVLQAYLQWQAIVSTR